MRARILAAGLFLPLCASAAPPDAPRFEAGVEMVTVDVRVVDDRGAPVLTLPRDAFSIEENGVPQTVESFEVVGSAPPARDAAHPAPPEVVSTNVQPRGRGSRTFIVVADDVHISPLNMQRVQDALVRFVTTVGADGDRVTLASTGSSLWWTGTLPASAGDLAVFINRLKGLRVGDRQSGANMTDWEAMRIHAGDETVRRRVFRRLSENGSVPDLMEPGSVSAGQANALMIQPGKAQGDGRAQMIYEEVLDRQRVTLKALMRLVGTPVAGSRPIVVLVSEGFVHDPQLTEMRDLKVAASRANATVHFVDAVGLAAPPDSTAAESTRRDALGVDLDVLMASFDDALQNAQGAISLAADTGGTVVRGNVDAALARVAGSARVFYALGYHSTNAARDGKYRKLSVKVRGAGLHVEARKGYYAAGGKNEAAREAPEAGIARALDAGVDRADIPLRLTAFVREPTPDGVTVLLAGSMDLASALPGDATALVDSEILVTGRDTGSQTRTHGHMEVRLDAASGATLQGGGLPILSALRLAPGPYQARLVVRESTTGRAGRVVHDFDVPDPSAFRVSTPALDDAAPGATGPAWSARRTFAAGGKLFVSFQVFGHTAGGEVLSALSITGTDGRVVAETRPSPMLPDPAGKLARTLAVSLAHTPPGEYDLTIRATDTTTGASAEHAERVTVAEGAP